MLVCSHDTRAGRQQEVNKITAATVTEVNKINITNKTSTSVSNTHTAVPS
jgi:hypothetical protein